MNNNFIMTGIIKKKGRHSMQGYKDREFTVDKKGILKYGPPGDSSKWKKQIKLSDISEIYPIITEPRHGFVIKKKDGRILYFTAQNDEEKWKWINGFRQSMRVINSPEWSIIDEIPNKNERQEFIAVQKLSKISISGIWRWRFFYINDNNVSYYGDPSLGDELGNFPLNSILKVQIIKNKHSKENVLQIDVKNIEKRSYFLTHPDEIILNKLMEILKPVEKKGLFSFWK